MKISLLVLCAATIAATATAQSLNVTTIGTVPRVIQPNIAPCSTAPEPYYFAVNGSMTGQLGANQELRLLVKPILLNGGPIWGCEWIKQCHTATPGPGGTVTFYGQMGTNNQQRSWFSGAQAQVALAILPTSAPVCISNPATVAIALSNITTINLDPTIPNLFDFQIPCRGMAMDVQGTPTPGQSVTFTLPVTSGAVAFGFLYLYGFLLMGCQAYFNPAIPIVIVSADASGVLTLGIPNNPSLIGGDLSTQGVLLGTNPAVDLTQPTLVQIR